MTGTHWPLGRASALGFIVAAGALASGAAVAECRVSGGYWFLGNDARFTMHVPKNEPCTRGVTLNSGAAAIHSLRIVQQASHGVAGVAGKASYAYKADRGYVGPDAFVVEIAGERRLGGEARTRLTIDVTVE
jgi:hypothetical protein